MAVRRAHQPTASRRLMHQITVFGKTSHEIRAVGLLDKRRGWLAFDHCIDR